MSGKHTPGPWTAGKGIVTASSHIGTHSDEANVLAYGAPLVCESLASEANASLIAAAPDLLEALEKVMRPYSLYDMAVARTEGATQDTMRQIGAELRAAIARARGEA